MSHPVPHPHRRLGRNSNGYRGESIDIDQTLDHLRQAALTRGWIEETFHAEHDSVLRAYHRRPSVEPRRRVYISAGIHGDEPAGPLAALELVGGTVWPDDVAVWVCPCLNPTGFRLGRRENTTGLDLNRQYLHLKARETRAHIAWLDRQPSFDVAFCLHEDWESAGFYVYELNPDGRRSLAETMVEKVAEVCPVDPSKSIDGREAQGGIIRPSADPLTRVDWPEAFYLMNTKTRVSYTLEAPSDFVLATRVAALVTGVKSAVEALRG